MPIPISQQFADFAATPDLIEAATQGLSTKQLSFAPSQDDWTIHEVLIHLPDSEAVGFWRLRKTIAEPGSTLPVYDEAAWAKNLVYRTQDASLALNLFRALRESSTALLRSLPAEAWECSAVHPERGRLTLYDIFLIYLDHGKAHLAQVERLKRDYSALY